ncbi:MAG: beta-ketoacyl-ACP synthase II, partial [Nitrospirales bacterium]|nr:beta-ketoacyl-ACP synthase II [Nitrospirales bacterium]
MRRVVVTGIGAVTPLAAIFSKTWSLARQGISGIRELTRFEP